MADPPADDGPILLTDITDHVGTITLNRPATRNALHGPLMAALHAAVQSMEEDPNVRVVVLTGAASEGAHGGFCSGGDVDPNSRGLPGGEFGVPPNALEGDLTRHDGHAAMRLHLMGKPTIAMVGGPAVGAGFSLAGACDLRFASDTAVFAANFSPNGLTGDYGGSFFWTGIVGTALARQLFLLNEKIPAGRALELGMVHAVVPAADLAGYTVEVATRLVKTPPSVVALTKSNLNEAESETDRRRFLLANEAANQFTAGRQLAERLGKKARPAAKG